MTLVESGAVVVVGGRLVVYQRSAVALCYIMYTVADTRAYRVTYAASSFLTAHQHTSSRFISAVEVS